MKYPSLGRFKVTALAILSISVACRGSSSVDAQYLWSNPIHLKTGWTASSALSTLTREGKVDLTNAPCIALTVDAMTDNELAAAMSRLDELLSDFGLEQVEDIGTSVDGQRLVLRFLRGAALLCETSDLPTFEAARDALIASGLPFDSGVGNSQSVYCLPEFREATATIIRNAPGGATSSWRWPEP